jgi:hypothetical protein
VSILRALVRTVALNLFARLPQNVRLDCALQYIAEHDDLALVEMNRSRPLPPTAIRVGALDHRTISMRRLH